MTALYWFATVVGVGMYLFSVFADVTGDADVGADGDVDFDVGHGHHHGLDGYKILSLRNATYFLFAFGVTGVLLNWLWDGGRSVTTALLSLTIGGLGAAMSTIVFGWLKRSESGDMPGDQSWIGAPADVVLPLSGDGTGKVYATRAGRTQELLARPFDAAAEHPERWTSVLVLDIKDGVALVAPHDQSLEATLPDDDAPRLGAPDP
jgi:hypothetical protein